MYTVPPVTASALQTSWRLHANQRSDLPIGSSCLAPGVQRLASRRSSGRCCTYASANRVWFSKRHHSAGVGGCDPRSERNSRPSVLRFRWVKLGQHDRMNRVRFGQFTNLFSEAADLSVFLDKKQVGRRRSLPCHVRSVRRRPQAVGCSPRSSSRRRCLR